MQDFLKQTLSRQPPCRYVGKTAYLRWQWVYHGVLFMEPLLSPVEQAVVLSAGIHGNETASVEILNQLLTPLLKGVQPLRQRLCVILGNPYALRLGKRYIRYDINRLFGKRWQQIHNNDEAQRVFLLEKALENFWQRGECGESRWHLDLHTTIHGSWHAYFGVLPFTSRPWSEKFMHWLSTAGMEAFVFHSAPSGTFTHFSCEHFAAASCTMELGKALPFGENNLSQFHSVHQALAGLLYGEVLPATKSTPRQYRVTQQITRSSDNFRLHISNETLNFTAFPKGTLLASDGKKHYVVQQSREFTLFLNPNVALGLNAGLMLVEEGRGDLDSVGCVPSP